MFDNAVTAETELRFSGLEATFDPSTIRYLTGVGVTDWLVIEDFSGAIERGSEPASPADAKYRKVHVALRDFLARANDDQSDFAASLPQSLASLGLADVGGEGRLVFGHGGSPAVRVMACAKSVIR